MVELLGKLVMAEGLIVICMLVVVAAAAAAVSGNGSGLLTEWPPLPRAAGTS